MLDLDIRNQTGIDRHTTIYDIFKAKTDYEVAKEAEATKADDAGQTAQTILDALPPEPGSGGMTGDGSTGIEDQAVPLAGIIMIRDVLEELYKFEGSPDGEDAEGEHDKAVAWAIIGGIIDEDADPEEIVTVAILRDILTRHGDRRGVKFTLAIEGGDDDIVMECGEILTEWFAVLS